MIVCASVDQVVPVRGLGPMFHSHNLSLFLSIIQDGRADVVANDAGDRVTPAVVAYRDDEQVR